MKGKHHSAESKAKLSAALVKNPCPEPGAKINRWTVIGPAPKRGFSRGVKVICECGTQKEITVNSLVSGQTKSCGCFRNEQAREKHLKPPGEAAKNGALDRMKRAAKKRGIDWRLSETEFLGLTSQNCYWCDRPPTNISVGNGNGAFIYSGIDRIDSDGYYTPDNTVPSCAQCNWAKSDYTAAEFLKMCQLVTQKHSNQQPPLSPL